MTEEKGLAALQQEVRRKFEELIIKLDKELHNLLQDMKPKYKAGQKVRIDTMGIGRITDSYEVKGKVLYHIKQGEYLLGNIPESFITLIPTNK